VKAAKQLMTVRDLPLSEIAISAGFAHQSHFTRVFSAAVGVSPGVWRREAHGVCGNRDRIRRCKSFHGRGIESARRHPANG
jgi:AraC-like DNA-binding protein